MDIDMDMDMDIETYIEMDIEMEMDMDMDNRYGLGKKEGYGHVTIKFEHEMDAYCSPMSSNIDAT